VHEDQCPRRGVQGKLEGLLSALRGGVRPGPRGIPDQGGFAAQNCPCNGARPCAFYVYNSRYREQITNPEALRAIDENSEKFNQKSKDFESILGQLEAKKTAGTIKEKDIGLLAIDVDGNDYWIWKAIECISPRVVVIEYQCIWGAEKSVTVPYSPDFKAGFSGQYGIYCNILRGYTLSCREVFSSRRSNET